MFKEIGEYLWAVSRQWEPLATGGAALMVSAVVGHYGSVPWWVWPTIVLSSIFIASYLAWRAIKQEKDKAKQELDILNTPSVSIELSEIEETVLTRSNTQTLFLKVIGISATYVRPEVFIVQAEAIKEGRGSCTLERSPGIAPSFGVHRNEDHRICAVTYKNNQMLLNCELPCKISVADTIRGNEFMFRVCAYGGPKETELKFILGVEDGALWAQQVGSVNRIKSHLRQSIDKIFDQGS